MSEEAKMVEIAKCRMCGSEAFKGTGYWGCSNNRCAVYGPSNDYDGTKWNALMSPTPTPEPAAGTVRVRIPVHIGKGGSMSVHWNLFSNGTEYDCIDHENPIAYITAHIPLPQPAEIPGTVESES